MTAKEYLSQIKNLELKINSYLSEIERLQALATKTTGIIKNDRVQASVEQQKMENAVVKLVDYKLEVSDDMERCVALKEKISGEINDVENPTYRYILTERYVRGESFERIAVGLNYSYRHTTRYHGAALSAFGKKHKDVLECPM